MRLGLLAAFLLAFVFVSMPVIRRHAASRAARMLPDPERAEKGDEPGLPQP